MPAVITVDKEMAVTRAMFLDTIARALAGRAHRIEDTRVIVDRVPLEMGPWYDFHEFECHLGNVGFIIAHCGLETDLGDGGA